MRMENHYKTSIKKYENKIRMGKRFIISKKDIKKDNIMSMTSEMSRISFEQIRLPTKDLLDNNLQIR